MTPESDSSDVLAPIERIARRFRYSPRTKSPVRSCSCSHAVAILGGIGFTMSLFVSSLAFARPEYVEQAKLGILLGSCLAALLGVRALSRTQTRASGTHGPTL